MGRHLFVLGLVLLLVVAMGFVTAGIVAVYLFHHDHPWWLAAGVPSVILAGVAGVLRAIPRILGPEGVTGIIKQRNNSPAIGLMGSMPESGQPPSSAS